MKNLLFILLIAPFLSYSQLTSFIVRSGASGDTLFAYNPSTGDYTQLTKQDTSSLPRFTEKVKGLITWANIASKPSTYTAATHSHVIGDVTGLQAAIDAKGTSNFDGVYSSLTGKPTLFDGAYASLTGKPTLFDGTYSSLTGKPSIFAPSSHTHTISEISDFGSYANASHTHVKADITDFPTTTAAFSNSTNKNFVTDAQATIIGNTSGTNTGDNAVNSLYSGLVSNANHTGDATGSTALTLATVNSNVGSFGSATQVGTFTVNGKGLVTAASNTSIAIAESQVTNLTTDLAAKAPLASPAFTGTPTGITASHVGLGNVTNESKATMFTSPTFTGNAVLGTPASGNFSTGTFTWPTFNQNTTGTAGGLSADIAESRVTNLVSDLAAKAPLTSPAFTGTPTGIGIPVYARVTSSDATTTGQALTNITGLSVALTTNAVYEFEAVLGVTTSAVTTGTQYAVQYSVAGGAVEGGITGPLTSTAAKAERIAALNTATSAYLTTSAQTGQVIIKGIITTGANAGNLTIQHLKVTSGTSTIKINSFLKVTRIS